MLPFKVETVVVCDDVRQEKTGKLILIGVYLDNIGVAALPVEMQLTWWLQVTGLEDYRGKFAIRLTNSQGGVLVRGDLEVSIQKNKRTFMGIEKMPVQIQAPGMLLLQFSVDEKEWETVRAIDVTLQGAKP
jgi:hypothetical protein